MDSNDILHYALALGFLVITAAFAYAFYWLAQAFKVLKNLLESIEDAADDVKLLKEKLKVGLAGLAGVALSKALRNFVKK